MSNLDRGEFEVRLAQGGDWLAFLQVRGTVYMEQRLQIGESSAAALELRVPAHGVLRLRLLLPPGLDSKRLSCSLRAAQDLNLTGMQEADGTWQFGWCAGGVMPLEVHYQPPLGGLRAIPMRVNRDALHYDPAQSDPLVVDLRATFPGMLLVAAEGPLASMEVVVAATDLARDVFLKEGFTAAGAMPLMVGLQRCNALGACLLSHLPPGAYRPWVIDPRQRWVWRAADTLEVLPGEDQSLVAGAEARIAPGSGPSFRRVRSCGAAALAHARLRAPRGRGNDECRG